MEIASTNPDRLAGPITNDIGPEINPAGIGSAVTRPILFLVGAILGLAACNQSPAPEDNALQFEIDRSNITVSGISSGAYMAGQYHLAHAKDISGAGLIAGGPYWCAQGSATNALGGCMSGSGLDSSVLVQYARSQSALGGIDSLEHLNGDRLWIFHGARDQVVGGDLTTLAGEFYSQISDDINITTVENVPAPHGLPTIAGGGSCDDMTPTFLNDCGFDAAGALLKAVTTITSDRLETPAGKIVSVDQINASDAGMLDQALLFVPADCAADKACGLHIVFHGCQQSTEFIGDTFVREAGFNEWASANRLLVLYPQVAKSRVASLNPLGCWDWWGYTGERYATREGLQISVVKSMVDRLAGVNE